jgi:predicted nuclease of restriction endonuclease-like (RecB) superfamily
VTDSTTLEPSDYASTLGELKQRVLAAQVKARRRVNTELIALYWSIGSTVLARTSWGNAVVGRLAEDLRAEFPTMKGFSRSNLFYMRSFAQAWPEFPANSQEKVQHPVGLLPWGHIVTLLDRLDEADARSWYAERAVAHGWSRNVLLNQIMNRAREREGASPSNFTARLGDGDSDLARQLAKDPYVFDFLDLADDVAERDLEQALTDRIVDTLRELGAGYAFVGRQVHFDVDGDDFYLDLLFFHVEQLRYVVIELKTGRFQPEFSGQLGFYVALVDDRLRREAHGATVGILVCGGRNDQTVRYALSGSTAPMAVSTYTYESLPAAERAALPDATRLLDALGGAGG